jgi:putative protein-disulfide isomerase
MILHLVHDPMCSWCYAFAPVWRRIRAALPASLAVEYVVGGLAPDSDVPMPAPMREYIQQTWRRIQSVVTGTEFNFEFWTRCAPRRSTYPACRAVLAARHRDPALEPVMIERIQHAYYREARNPSDADTLEALAGEIGLDVDEFRAWVGTPACEAMLAQDFAHALAFGVPGFPSLVLSAGARHMLIPHDYANPDVTLDALRALGASSKP